MNERSANSSAGDQVDPFSRRTFLGSAAALTATGLLVSACGTAAGASPSSTAVSDPKELGPTSSVPVGSAKIFGDKRVVVLQPTAGTFVGLSAVCPHGGCIVSKVEVKDITCPCHGSAFSVKDGSLVHGPAPQGLSPAAVTVKDGALYLA
jgi:nitrite reductase/ring-hydroxylating ferredoxin subunit